MLSRIPSKKHPEIFLPSSRKTSPTATSDAFTPLTLRSFATSDDFRDSIVPPAATRVPRGSDRADYGAASSSSSRSGRFVGSCLRPLTLDQLRLTFVLIDCYLIVARFYTTYRVLREMLVGRRVVVDASTYLVGVAATATSPDAKEGTAWANGAVENNPRKYTRPHEVMRFQCGHSPTLLSVSFGF